MTPYFIHYFLLLLLLSPFPPGNALEDSERILWIETSHKGPYTANSSVVFSCIHKLKDPFGVLTWSFLLSSSNSPIPADIDWSPDDSSVGFNRTSSIRIPSEDVSAISCLWSNLNGSITNTSMPISVTGLQHKIVKREDLCLSKSKGPQIWFINMSRNCDRENEDYFKIVSGEEIHLNMSSSEGFILLCLQPGKEEEDERLQWSVTPENNKPSHTLVLNYLALINWKRAKIEKCPRRNMNRMNDFNITKSSSCPISNAGPLEVYIVPEKTEVTSVFTCSRSKDMRTTDSVSVTVKTLPVHRKLPPGGAEDENKEFIELVNILMQILQGSDSSSGGSGSGPLYGMGFGSTTIIALMAIAIYYLKRQIKQLQEQVELTDRRRRKSRPSNTTHDEEDDL